MLIKIFSDKLTKIFFFFFRYMTSWAKEIAIMKAKEKFEKEQERNEAEGLEYSDEPIDLETGYTKRQIQKNEMREWLFILYKTNLDGQTMELKDVGKALSKCCSAANWQLEDAHPTEKNCDKIHYQGLAKTHHKATLVNIKAVFTKADKRMSGIWLRPRVKSQYGKPLLYVNKIQTRIDGPWTLDTFRDDEVPEEFKDGFDPKPFQQTIMDRMARPSDFSDRASDWICCTNGGTGRTKLKNWMRHKKLANVMGMPPTAERLLANAHAHYARTENPKWIIDVPRGAKFKEDFWEGVETLKDGHVLDARYALKEIHIMTQVRLVFFSNRMPPANCLSSDKLNVWVISADEELVLYKNEKQLHNINEFWNEKLQLKKKAMVNKDPKAYRTTVEDDDDYDPRGLARALFEFENEQKRTRQEIDAFAIKWLDDSKAEAQFAKIIEEECVTGPEDDSDEDCHEPQSWVQPTPKPKKRKPAPKKATPAKKPKTVKVVLTPPRPKTVPPTKKMVQKFLEPKRPLPQTGRLVIRAHDGKVLKDTREPVDPADAPLEFL